MVHITIDGKNLEVPEGTTILRAAQSAGIHIPTLCDHPELTPYGGCRLCLVEVEGMRALQPSCTLPCANNMVVHTNTERLISARKFVLSLIFSERNHFCPYCQVSGGDCELQNAAYSLGMTHWPLQPNWQRYEVDASHPYFVLDHNRCILCRRCVRACGELVGNYTLGFEERGANSFLIADFGVPLGQSSCISCGTCVQICPTGALIDRVSAYRGKETQVEHHKTVCVGCSIGCGIDVLTRDNSLVRIEGDWDAPINDGIICKIGRFLPLEDKRERVTTPLLRKNGKLAAATWDQALDAITSKLSPLVSGDHDTIAALVSTRLPAETLHLFKQIFADKIQSKMVTSLEEGIYSTASAKLADQIGKDFEGNLADLKTTDCAVLIGIDLVNNHEVAGFFVKRILYQGTKLVILDTQPNPLETLAQLVLKPVKGSEADIIQGLTAAIVQQGLEKSSVTLDTEKILSGVTTKTGLSAETFLAAARIIAEAERPVFVYGKSLSDNTGQALRALLELSRACNGKLINPKGQANSLAASQYHLDKPFTLDGQKVVYIALGDEEPSQRLIQKLSNKEFLVVQASYVSQLTAMADVVLPVEMWAEQEGHYLNMDGHLQKAQKSLAAPEEVRSSFAVLKTISERLGLTVDDSSWRNEIRQRVSPVAIREN